MLGAASDEGKGKDMLGAASDKGKICWEQRVTKEIYVGSSE